jgi:YegS/Rv2252/BmrU family lipid kinase
VARALLIANPGAARTHSGVVRQIERVFNTAGWQVETLATVGPGDARKLAQYGLEQSVDVVAVLGGDGTIMQVAAALVGTQVPMGVLPGGTGNQLAGNLRLSFNPVRAAAALIRGTPRAFDLGRLDRPDGAHYFAVGGGAGLDARVMAATQSSHKRRWGQLAYVATTLRLLADVECVPFHIEADGVGHDFEAALILVANCGEIIPPLFKLGQNVSPYDGILDVIILSANSVGGGVRALWHVVREAKGEYGKTVFATRVSGAEIRVTTPAGAQPVQLDGEPTGETPFVATVMPGAIQLIHPEG